MRIYTRRAIADLTTTHYMAGHADATTELRKAHEGEVTA
jgi:hypothetical protein